MIGRRQRVIDLPEAGKPEGLCPECGPHGNRGVVELLFSLVSCNACDDLATRRAMREAEAAEMQIAGELAGEGCTADDAEVSVEPLAGHPGGRRVVVTVPYRHAPVVDVAAALASARAALTKMRGAVRP
jgi:hypothetical protein